MPPQNSPGVPGELQLVYRYTVTGADKASIDTGVDTPDAGSNDWTNGDLLEVWLYSRTDEVTVFSELEMTFNNDTGLNYDMEYVQGVNASASSSVALASAYVQLTSGGSSLAANVFNVNDLCIPGYFNTVGQKAIRGSSGHVDTTAANTFSRAFSGNWRSTSAITRLKVTPHTAGKKLKVGTQLLIYKRLAY